VSAATDALNAVATAMTGVLSAADASIGPGSPLIATGLSILNYLSVIAFCLYLIRFMLGGGERFDELIENSLRLGMVYFIARACIEPVYLGVGTQTTLPSVVFSSFAWLGDQLAGLPDMRTGTVDQMLGGVSLLIKGIVSMASAPLWAPNTFAGIGFDPVEFANRALAAGLNFILNLAFRLITLIFLAVATIIYAGVVFMALLQVKIAAIFAPLLAAFLVFRPLDFLFWGWLNFALTAGMTLVVANVIMVLLDRLISVVPTLVERVLNSAAALQAAGVDGAVTGAYIQSFYAYAMMMLVAGIVMYAIAKSDDIARALISGGGSGFDFHAARTVLGSAGGTARAAARLKQALTGYGGRGTGGGGGSGSPPPPPPRASAEAWSAFKDGLSGRSPSAAAPSPSGAAPTGSAPQSGYSRNETLLSRQRENRGRRRVVNA
jgi:hypothetical protein